MGKIPSYVVYFFELDGDMLIGVISDIHGNMQALEAVLAAMKVLHVDEILCAGDIVGYGANPVECVDLVREKSRAAVAGNHEMGVMSQESNAFFNKVAREACLWTRAALGPPEKAYIAALPLVRELRQDRLVLVHAELCLPGLFDYIQTLSDARDNILPLPPGFVCFFGHSHAPFVFLEGEALAFSTSPEVAIAPGARALVNVGSVGQPRDGDPRSCFATMDTEERTVRMHRVWYDYEQAGERIRRAGLPEILADRLRYGR